MVFAGLGLNPAGVLLFRNHALLSSLGLFRRSYAPESSLRMKWPLPRRPLQAMASLHHLSLGPQNATLGTFAGVGFRRFGLESCWGSAVSQPRSTELLGAVSELCSREFFADDVATSTEAAPGNGIIASSFFRASERNVRQFCGRWFSQVWGWILLRFCCFATTLYWAPWGCFGAMLQRVLCGWSGYFHGGRSRQWHHASSFFRASERNVRHFCGRWFSQVWAWILLGFCCFATTLYWAPWGCFGAMLQRVPCGWSGQFHGGRSRQWHHCIIFLKGLRTQR